MAFDPSRARRLASRVSALSALGGSRRMGSDHGPCGGAGRAAAGVRLHRRHDCAGPSKGVRRACEQIRQLSPRSNRNTSIQAEALGRSRGGLGTKIVGVCDAAGRLVDFLLVPGQAHELAPSLVLLKRLPEAPTWALADMACDAREVRSAVRALGAIPVVPSRKGAKQPQPCPAYTYRHSNPLVPSWSRPKQRPTHPPR